LEKDLSETDRFGRLLRYVYTTDGALFNEVPVQEGYATVDTFPPDVKYVERFTQSQKEARDGNRGLWVACLAVQATTANEIVGDGNSTDKRPG